MSGAQPVTRSHRRSSLKDNHCLLYTVTFRDMESREKERSFIMKPNHMSRHIYLLFLAAAALNAQAVRSDLVPLKNWATPLYWQPNQTERGVAVPGAQLTFSSNQVSSNALTFIAITPCRLVDTRGAGATLTGSLLFRDLLSRA